jgi:hypothetical protein
MTSASNARLNPATMQKRPGERHPIGAPAPFAKRAYAKSPCDSVGNSHMTPSDPLTATNATSIKAQGGTNMER